MRNTKIEVIREWLQKGIKSGATHCIVITDKFDWENYPVYVFPTQEVEKIETDYRSDTQQVTEIYDLSMDLESQLNESRAFHR